MQAQTILTIFFALLLLEQIIETALSLINLRHAGKKQQDLPSILSGLYDSETAEKSLEYTKIKTYFSIFSSWYSLFILLFLIYRQFFPILDQWIAGYELSLLMQGTLYLLSVIVLLSLFQLPVSYLSTFYIEESFGFNKSTKLLWLKDQLLGLVLSITLSGILILVLLYFMNSFPDTWWLYSSTALILFQVLIAFIFPIFIAPLFNKFTDLPEGELKTEILKLSERVGYKTTGVYTVDGSKRSKHANAYFAGLGKSKRIVLYDTLINLLNTKQILAVLAHEIGHEKKGHIKKSLLMSSLVTFVMFYVLNYFYQSPEFYVAFGFAQSSNHAALLIFSLLSSPVMYFINPLSNVLSRRFEYQADAFAVDSIGEYEPLATSLANLSKNSLSNLNPHPLYSFMHYSHPTLVERIRAMSNKA